MIKKFEFNLFFQSVIAACVVAIALFSGPSYTVFAAGGGGVLTDPGAMEGKHFDKKGKMPSKFTIELQKGLRKSLPFDDKRDFEEAKKGFIAEPTYKQSYNETDLEDKNNNTDSRNGFIVFAS